VILDICPSFWHAGSLRLRRLSGKRGLVSTPLFWYLFAHLLGLTPHMEFIGMKYVVQMHNNTVFWWLFMTMFLDGFMSRKSFKCTISDAAHQSECVCSVFLFKEPCVPFCESKFDDEFFLLLRPLARAMRASSNVSPVGVKTLSRISLAKA